MRWNSGDLETGIRDFRTAKCEDRKIQSAGWKYRSTSSVKLLGIPGYHGSITTRKWMALEQHGLPGLFYRDLHQLRSRRPISRGASESHERLLNGRILRRCRLEFVGRLRAWRRIVVFPARNMAKCESPVGCSIPRLPCQVCWTAAIMRRRS